MEMQYQDALSSEGPFVPITSRPMRNLGAGDLTAPTSRCPTTAIIKALPSPNAAAKDLQGQETHNPVTGSPKFSR